jgi:TRAP-type C4-dicarboxylate transport system permease small subunit
MSRLISIAPKFIVGFLVLFAISVMLCGVFLRYVMLPITEWIDMDPFNFFWVEEVGELTLTWLVMIGAALGVAENSHFSLNVFTHKLSPRGQKNMATFNQLLIAGFAGLVAWICYKLTILNSTLSSPALEISLGLFYVSATVGGVLMVFHACNNVRLLQQSGNSVHQPGGH